MNKSLLQWVKAELEKRGKEVPEDFIAAIRHVEEHPDTDVEVHVGKDDGILCWAGQFTFEF